MRELLIISGEGGTGKTNLTASFAVLADRPAAADYSRGEACLVNHGYDAFRVDEDASGEDRRRFSGHRVSGDRIPDRPVIRADR